MKQRVSDLETLEAFLDTVVGRHEHHAHGFKAAVLGFAGFLVHYSDRFETLSKPVEAQYPPAWFSMNGKTYGLLYDVASSALQVKAGNPKGAILFALTGATTLEDIAGFFEANW
ncbi:MAG: hypothetical protein SFY70_13205 [Bacteroidia bacterium]|nr:hypothetical protein [Bacteroidia bacterium]